MDRVNQSPLTSHGSGSVAGIGARQRIAGVGVVTRKRVNGCTGTCQWWRLPSMTVTLFIIVTGVICTIAAVIFIWQVVLPWVRRLRRRAETPTVETTDQAAVEPAEQAAVEPATTAAVQPPQQLPPAPIVNVYPQAPYQGGAVSTMPGPGSATALTSFETFPNAGAQNNPPGPAFQPGIHLSDSDAGHGEDLP
jgi:hypothetical protein